MLTLHYIEEHGICGYYHAWKDVLICKGNLSRVNVNICYVEVVLYDCLCVAPGARMVAVVGRVLMKGLELMVRGVGP